MPTRAQIRDRGGVKRIRTVVLPNGKYAHVYVMRKPGKRGGKTIMVVHKRKKGRR